MGNHEMLKTVQEIKEMVADMLSVQKQQLETLKHLELLKNEQKVQKW